MATQTHPYIHGQSLLRSRQYPQKKKTAILESSQTQMHIRITRDDGEKKLCIEVAPEER